MGDHRFVPDTAPTARARVVWESLAAVPATSRIRLSGADSDRDPSSTAVA